MRILQIITLSELGGAQSVVINLSNHLSKKHEVMVVAGEGDGKIFELLDDKIRTKKIDSLVRRLSPINEIKTIYRFRKIYESFKPDIIHLHSSKAGLLGRIAFPGNKTVYTVHGFDSIRIAYRKFLPIERIMQYKCAYIVGVSSYDEVNMKKERITRNVTYIYNGIYAPLELDYPPFTFADNYSKKILCIARLSKQKKMDLFIEVAKSLPQYAFIWIGNLEKPNIIIPTNVFFLGNVLNAGAYTAYADLFILTSNYEGLPMVIIESLSKGIPVIASNVGGIPELLKDNNGWAIENRKEIFVDKIEEYFNLPLNKKNEMSIEAQMIFEKFFTVDKMAEEYLKLYTEIIKNKK